MVYGCRIGLVVGLLSGIVAGACAGDDGDDEKCVDCRAWYDDCVTSCDEGDEECPEGCELTAWESDDCDGCSLD